MFHDSQKDNNQEDTTASRRRFLKQGGFATAFATVAAAFGLTPFSPAKAATVSSQGVPQVVALTGNKAESYIHNVLTSQGYLHFQQRVQRDYAGVLIIQQHATVAQRFSDGKNTLVQVHVPITGGEGHSFYAVSFQEGSSTILQAQSGIFTLTPERNLVALIEKNGLVVVDASITPKGELIQGTVSISANKHVALHGLTSQQALAAVTPDVLSTEFCCLLNGLVLFGVLDVAVGLALALACAGPCAVTLGGACLLCMSVYGIFAGATVGFVIGDCQRNPLAFGGFFGCP